MVVMNPLLLYTIFNEMDNQTTMLSMAQTTCSKFTEPTRVLSTTTSANTKKTNVMITAFLQNLESTFAAEDTEQGGAEM